MKPLMQIGIHDTAIDFHGEWKGESYRDLVEEVTRRSSRGVRGVNVNNMFWWRVARPKSALEVLGYAEEFRVRGFDVWLRCGHYSEPGPYPCEPCALLGATAPASATR